MKRALITGITGQDGSYLAELLLSKGYEVHGIIRRSSSFNTARLDSVYRDPHEGGRLHLAYGDLTDASSLSRILRAARPDEIYNLGAQSHVRVSFDVPDYTADVGALGTVRLLEAARETGLQPRFYQASSSELFGSSPPPQSESTPFHPRSPYAVAKLYAYWITVNYREAYGLHASNGILFNHECVTAETPVIFRRKGTVDIAPIEEIVAHREDPTHSRKKQTSTPVDLEVWDRDCWTRVTCATATWANDRNIVRVRSRGAVFSATTDHVAFVVPDEERCCGLLKTGDMLSLSALPDMPNVTTLTDDEAWLLGIIAADGWVDVDGKSARVTNNDVSILDNVTECWRRVSGGYAVKGETSSGFTDEVVATIELRGNSEYLRYIRPQLYTERGFKRVPKRILNANLTAQRSFLVGYNRGDGLKAGHCDYEFKSWKTNSPTLAAGLWWLANTVLKQRTILCTEDRIVNDELKTYYTINLNSPNTHGAKGAHLRRPTEEIVGVDQRTYTGWLFDLATDSGTFHAGVGSGWIHNSPRRGETFVTRKITRAAARIKLGKQDKLFLGNLDAKRDWGHAADYVEAMWLMLQQERPDDYVIATGETHTVREFLDLAFGYLDLDWRRHVEVDPRYFRPAEVEALCGDASKAREKLGWQPRTSFRELVEGMVLYDLQDCRRLVD